LTTDPLALVRLLADGELHGAEELRALYPGGSEDPCTLAARTLDGWGLELRREPGGIRLAAPPDLLDGRMIREGLSPSSAACVRRLEVHAELSSTNDALLAVGDVPAGRSDVMLAEYQTAGRGRHGRPWLAPFAAGICLSLSWRFTASRTDASALGPAVGVAVLRALRRLGLRGMGLKWPNDVLVGEKKLAGTLCELRTDSATGAYVVVGIGLNHRLPERAREDLRAAGRAAIDLAQLAFPAALPPRNAVVIALTDAVLLALNDYGARGFAVFRDEWAAADTLVGRAVTVHRAGTIAQGVARGIASDGAFRVELPDGLVRLNAGEVSLRAAT
jgi:BirA family transcriptional regulator, biotin operon repressor / biotin---[acetyl-CoA-carboxylase] ligase